MGKYKLPKLKEILKRKRKFWRKREPVWIYLEREMLANVDKKPYNEKVGEWLRFMKDMKEFFHCDAKQKLRKLREAAGPPWYCELSSIQRDVLKYLRSYIHQDLLENLPIRTRKALYDLGLTAKIPKAILMNAMVDSVEDPGVFIWNLYTALYKKAPSELRTAYDLDSMILISSLVVIDIDECIENLIKVSEKVPPRPPKPPKQPEKYYQPNVRYGEYLQKMYVPCIPKPRLGKPKPKKPLALAGKIKLKSDESYERLCMDHSFLEKRKERNKKENEKERVCHYKFWEPPSTLRNTDPKMAAYVVKLKMYRKKARPKHLKYKAPYENVQIQIGNVSYTGGHPWFILNSVSLLPTGYIPINGGVVFYEGEYITNILGYWKFPKNVVQKCENTCNCLTKWEGTVMDYLKESKCKCGHFYDLRNEGKALEKYFYPSNKHGKFWLDKAKIYQLDPMEDYIKSTFEDALKSVERTPVPSMPTISPSGLKEKELLAAFLAELTETPLLIPHLPKANLLNSLQEWVRKRVKGAITPAQHVRWRLHSQRKWQHLKHVNFKELTYQIPFTPHQLKNISWKHRCIIQRLFETLLQDFAIRNRSKLVEHTRLFWATMRSDAYPSQSFLDVFFTYMPSRLKDTFIIDPYSSERTPRNVARTCPLNI